MSDPEVHAALASLLSEIANFGDAIADRAAPNVRRDPVFLGQGAELRQRLGVVDSKLGGVRSITAYHLGLLALWAGDAADAEPQFASVVSIAQQTAPLDDVGRRRLAKTVDVRGLRSGPGSGGARPMAKGHCDFDLALTASCRAAADDKTNRQADYGFILGRANLVALDTRAIRNDRLIALLNARNSGDGRVAVTSPNLQQLAMPAKGAASGDADAEARALFASLSVAGDPTLAANLQLRAALMGERDVVQRPAEPEAQHEPAVAQQLDGGGILRQAHRVVERRGSRRWRSGSGTSPGRSRR